MWTDSNTPSAEARPATKSRAWLLAAIVFVLAFDLAFTWQRRAGAYASELGGHPDEASNYVTGLMVHDYLARGFSNSPRKFAEEFYRHYPKASHVVWPPAFHTLQAVWMLPFGQSKSSILLLMCALAAVVGVFLFRALHENFGLAPAAIATVLFLSLPLVREYYSLIMAEMLCTAAMFAAALAFGRFLEREKTSHALWFGVLAALAIMTEDIGLALALVVPLGLLLTGKWRLLRRPAFWGAAALIALLVGPWIWFFPPWLKGGWSDPSWRFIREALPYYAGKIGLAIGALLALFMILGLWVKLLQPAERHGRWSALAALIASIVIFHGIVPGSLESRHLLPALPAALMFAVAGCAHLARRFETHATSALSVGLAVIAVLTFGLLEFILPATRTKEWTGFQPIAKAVLDDKESQEGRVLVCSDACGEGMFIAEMASAEKRPGHMIDRASELLADQKPTGRYALSKFSDDEELTDFLLDRNLNYIVFDDSVPDLARGSYYDMLKRVLTENSERFWEVTSAPMVRGTVVQETPIRLYRVLARNRFN